MKKQSIFLAIISISFSLLVSYNFGYHSGSNENSFEIYTSNDIYHVNGLNVKSESGTIDFHFRNQESLKNFISTLTADDSNNAKGIIENGISHRYILAFGEPETDAEICTYLNVVYSEGCEDILN